MLWLSRSNSHALFFSFQEPWFSTSVQEHLYLKTQIQYQIFPALTWVESTSRPPYLAVKVLYRFIHILALALWHVWLTQRSAAWCGSCFSRRTEKINSLWSMFVCVLCVWANRLRRSNQTCKVVWCWLLQFDLHFGEVEIYQSYSKSLHIDMHVFAFEYVCVHAY